MGLGAKRLFCAASPGPGWRKCTAYRQTGPGGPPLVLRLSEGLGLREHTCDGAIYGKEDAKALKLEPTNSG